VFACRGLGDRHPSNLMLDKLSGRILHIGKKTIASSLEVPQ
jgi:phosphatidylinositol kinase/protein kinase (PI-3  family)